MNLLLVYSLTALLACSSPQQEAADAALAYVTSEYVERAAAYDLACTDERAAKSKDDYLAELDSVKSLVGPKWDELLAAAKSLKRTVKSTTLNADQSQGSVTITSVGEDEASPAENEVTVLVRLEGDGWCVITGWSEQKRLDGIVSEIESLTKTLDEQIDTWALAEAELTLGTAEAKLSELPVEHLAQSRIASSVAGQRGLLTAKKTGWVGGRWRVTEEVDPMTDQKNMTAHLQSATKMPNSIGDEKSASLIVRCTRGELDVYVSTPVMLDSDWRYDSVSGQHRFGSAPPEKLTGGVSKGRDAVFLRNPNAWLAQFAAHESDAWTVELPVYGRMPASVKFDLTGVSKALAAVPDECK